MGLRIGEICALQWKDIDINNQVINVNYTVLRIKNTLEEATTKTILIRSEPKTENSKRVIHIPSVFLELFKKLKQTCLNEEHYLLTNSSKIMEPRCYYNIYKKILKKIEIEEYDFHSLRHTFATRCIELGFDPKTLSEILGHSDIRITLAFYVHPSNVQKIRSMEKISFLST